MPNRLLLIILILLAFLLRVGDLDAKGLAYDEAATALMARATPAEIIAFHWRAAFEHPPVWQLLMQQWSLWAGQREFALRFLPALAGVLHIPLVWQLAQVLAKSGDASDEHTNDGGQSVYAATPHIAATLTAAAPVLIHYSQEARMYTLVVTLALASMWLVTRFAATITPTQLLAWIMVNWLMLGLHYYSVLLLGAEAIFFLVVLARGRAPLARWLAAGGGLLVSVLALLAWMSYAPGFRETLQIVLRSASEPQPNAVQFLTGLWKDTTFGAIRWQPAQAWLGYLVLPPFALGMVAWAIGRPIAQYSTPTTWLIVVALVVPILFSSLFFRTLATRYILLVAPLLILVVAAGIAWLGRIDWRMGALWLAVALAVAGGGLLHYHIDYTKSDYRAMAAYLNQQLTAQDAILLEAPRQHLLAKYYLAADRRYYTAPQVELPAFWPVNAPPVVPEELDDQLQSYLRNHRTLWLILTAEDEVDKGEFVDRYLTAVSYREQCQAWLDVRLCRFVSPHYTKAMAVQPLDVDFAGELQLQRSRLALAQEVEGARFLLVTLDWLALAKPSLDYRVTLRLLDASGVVISQQDAYPIGPLLPPSTWNAGDAKPGYMTLPLPSTANGEVRILVGLYDPATNALVAHSKLNSSPSNPFLSLWTLDVGEDVAVQ